MRLPSQHRSLAALAVAVVAGVTLAGCSSGGATPGTSSPPKADLSGVTLNVAADWSGAEQANFEKVLAQFESDTGAKVNYTSYGSNVATTLNTKIAGGDPPDVAVIPQPGLLTSLAKAGSLIPLSADTLATVKKYYSQDWVDLGSVDGKTYGVWFKGSNKSTVWYNTKVYDNAGATVPKTWDDFVAALQKVSDSGVPGLSIGADVGWPLTDWFENVYLRTAGPEKYDQLTQHTIPWTDPSVIDALTILSKLWSNKALIEPGGAQRTFGDSVTEVFGNPPKAGTVYEGDFVAGNITSQTKSVIGTDAKFFDFPSINGSGPAVVGGGNAAVQLKDNKGAAALMAYLASPEAATIWVKLGGFTSPNNGVDMSAYPDDTSQQIAAALVNAKTFRFDMSDQAPSAFGGTAGSGEWKILLDFYSNPTDIQGTAKALEAAATADYK
ncbi:ABC-type glycerol-3-phosphate transport system substrate-binding protein [Cryobacterium mesophilum]|uniref:Extracellular solute-binding protein n=1 Tax=Terrimesophilobacter mesophilus TaxID=433647 RepID=A0A4V3I9N4_9MICO|nr:extracellular solute-binding protein [Terrimesophilobacter mesophilus]MBB5633452.1 ABC-type glycerol-3-phosphate transport system substrate-binding protein [Terrimesophilobacter mesophilus]TFB80168.1 extracellular solute-binding protein [Terrimesophilobacter mesophilus]